MTDNDEPRFVELTSVSDPIQAELLAVFLDSTGLEFRMLGVRSAPVLAGLIPGAQEPVVFQVPEDRLETARELLTEYQLAQAREFVPSEFPPPYEGEDGDDGDQPERATETDEDHTGSEG
jgi:hypothetical protein